jgi:hypothetical protein
MANSDPSRAALGSDAWMLEQQLRAEWEASEWRRIRAELALPPPQLVLPQEPARERPWHEGGSGVLKGLVRFGIGAFGAWMGYIAAASADGTGELEIVMAVIAGFFIALMISMLGPFKPFVALLAEIARWVLIAGVVVGGFWFVAHLHTA